MHPIFVLVLSRLEEADRELQRLDAALSSLAAAAATPEHQWIEGRLIASTVEDLYTGVETVLKDIAAEIDGHVPKGDDWHAKLLEQMRLAMPGVRKAVLSAETSRLLNELRGFRHVVRQRYGSQLDAERVRENLIRLRAVLPLLDDDIGALVGRFGSEAEVPDE